MNYKIVMDSSGDRHAMPGVPFASAPLKVYTAEREFADVVGADVMEMVDYLAAYKGKISSACPGVGDFLQAFGDAQEIYCITITSNLSGCYNAAVTAAASYLEAHPDRKVHVFDSLSTGPEMVLLAERIQSLVEQGVPFEEVVQKLSAYSKETHLIFALESLHNLANNGRVSGAVAKMSGILGIRIIGKASDVGTLEIISKVRGEKKMPPEIFRRMQELHYNGGRVHIDHCSNPAAAERLRGIILDTFPAAEVDIHEAGILCSFYAERGGLLIGFEG